MVELYMWLWLALWWTIVNSVWLVKTFGGPPLPISACQTNARNRCGTHAGGCQLHETGM